MRGLNGSNENIAPDMPKLSDPSQEEHTLQPCVHGGTGNRYVCEYSPNFMFSATAVT